jgi:hypothetical protein
MSLIALMMEAVSTSETPVNFYQTTLCNIPENSHLQILTVLEETVLMILLHCCHKPYRQGMMENLKEQNSGKNTEINGSTC